MFKKIIISISNYNRIRKFKEFLENFSVTEKTKVLDIGFTAKENLDIENFFEKKYKYRENITALGVDFKEKDIENILEKYKGIRLVKYGGKIFPFEDKSFDIGFSNAVIEHVGDKERQVLFLKEIKRTCKQAFISTPNKFFPFELHTKLPLLHIIFSKKIFDKILKFLGKGWAAGDYMNLLSIKEMKKLLKSAGIDNYIIIKNKFFGFTMDFVVLIK